VEALEAAAAPGAAYAVVERSAAVGAGRVAGELPPQLPLLLVPGREARGQSRLGARRRAPALDAAGGFEPGDGRDEMPAREVVRGGERLAVRAIGALLSDSRSAERAAHRDASERARLAPELARYNPAVGVSDHGGQHDSPHAACGATAGCP